MVILRTEILNENIWAKMMGELLSRSILAQFKAKSGDEKRPFVWEKINPRSASDPELHTSRIT